jgi:hypothetical protein
MVSLPRIAILTFHESFHRSWIRYAASGVLHPLAGRILALRCFVLGAWAEPCDMGSANMSGPTVMLYSCIILLPSLHLGYDVIDLATHPPR